MDRLVRLDQRIKNKDVLKSRRSPSCRGKVNELNRPGKVCIAHMGFILSSRSGHLCVDGKRVLKPHTDGIFPSGQFCDGDLSIPSTVQNILTISQCFLDLFINPIGMLQEQRPKGKKWLHSTLEIERELEVAIPTEKQEKISKGSLPRSPDQTRGWHLYTMHTLHRFFWKEFDCVRGSRKHEETDDYHWWLENSHGDVIDLAEEQYRAGKLTTLREKGKKLKPLGQQYSATSRAMAHRITEVLSSRRYNASLIDQYANAYMKR